jgi:hypothetical protein
MPAVVCRGGGKEYDFKNKNRVLKKTLVPGQRAGVQTLRKRLPTIFAEPFRSNVGAEEEVLFIGTQFSNLSTAVDTSAAAACNAWCVCQAPPQPYSLLHASTSAPARPSGTSVSPPPSTQASTIHTLCDNLSTDKLNK